MSIARLVLVLSLLGLPTAFLVSSAASARAQDKPAAAKEETQKERKLRKVRELLASMQQREIAEKSMDVMLESMGAPKEYAQKFKDAFDFDGMIESTVAVYEKHLDEEEIDAMVKFYASDSGKKIAAAMPDITIDSMKAGQEYGKRAAEEAGGK
jgi:uncharacterized protein